MSSAIKDKETAKNAINTLIEEGFSSLDKCKQSTVNKVEENSLKMRQLTTEALGKGQAFLDSLSDCSKRPILQLVPCYRGIILRDVLPTKTALLSGIHGHKTAHARTVELREEANQCVDDLVITYKQNVKTIVNKFVS